MRHRQVEDAWREEIDALRAQHAALADVVGRQGRRVEAAAIAGQLLAEAVNPTTPMLRRRVALADAASWLGDDGTDAEEED